MLTEAGDNQRGTRRPARPSIVRNGLRCGLWAMLFAGTVVGGGRAVADTPASERVRNLLFGAHLYGVREDTGAWWSECITPQGETVFRSEGYVSLGTVSIGADAQACFTYHHPDETPMYCFGLERSGGKTVFVSERSDVRFRVDRVVRPVNACGEAVPVS